MREGAGPRAGSLGERMHAFTSAQWSYGVGRSASSLAVQLAHSLAGCAANPAVLQSLCVQGDLSYLFVVSTTEKQWGASQATLRQVLASFKV